ncbi:ABC transporter ATP-binding protein [Streptomyces sp. NBC_00091]|uniref:ABC transporter ATP-binding protein n=1 Tax=Streptomyces sp. NBC_00091 TaxID=2975648 RepID=UPI0022562CF2|nr:ABC transporter ATP-binding protein [Streptomyces sp. NBC_00091]MCX5381030.1 ABC transporter ATP-binding protein [Streptomyces sp. NBC_00091]
MMMAIEIAGLYKSFGRTHALKGLDLRVEKGEVHGFLGPNGAGKSTTLRILLGLIRADRGRVRLLGGDPWRDAVALHQRVAYVPGDVNLWRNLSGGDALGFLGGLRENTDPRFTKELMERFELDPGKKGRAYSKGNRQKVALVAAFASDAELLVFDEPTSGLDPLAEEVFQSCVGEATDEGRTVLLSSHVLTEVEALCDRVSIVRDGRTVETGTLARMRHLSRTCVTAELAAPVEGLEELPGVHGLEVHGTEVSAQVDPEHLGTLLRVLSQTGVRSLVSRPPTLEELFLRHYRPEAEPVPAGAPGPR